MVECNNPEALFEDHDHCRQCPACGPVCIERPNYPMLLGRLQGAVQMFLRGVIKQDDLARYLAESEAATVRKEVERGQPEGGPHGR